MAGVSPAPPPLSESTVVVIDAQREYTDGKLPLTNVQPALAEIGKLLKRARALQIPVIHIVHQGKPGGAFGPDTPGFEVASPATPAPGEAVVSKSLPNAFASTDLASRLAALKKPNVVLVGFMTHLCVEATARLDRSRFQGDRHRERHGDPTAPRPARWPGDRRGGSTAQRTRGDCGSVRHRGGEGGCLARLIIRPPRARAPADRS
jgi:hypothetical protein